MARYVTSPIGFALIKAFEGFRPVAAPLSNSGWVIGYGHTVSARKGTLVSKKDASDLLKWDVARLEAPLCDLIYAPLSQNQFDALASLVFNIGLVNFKNSTVLRRLNEGCPVDAAAGFDAWRRARLAGKVIVVDALVRRRAAEKALFLASPKASVVAPTPQLPPLCDTQFEQEQPRETPLKVKVDLLGNGETTVEKPKSNEDVSPASKTVEGAATGLISLDDAFDTPNTQNRAEEISTSPVVEAAEHIAGRLKTIASEPEPEPEPEPESEPEKKIKDDVLQLQLSDEVPEEFAPPPMERAEVDDDLPPPLVDEEGLLLEPYEAEIATDAQDTFDPSAPQFSYDVPDYDDPDIDPQTLLADAQTAPESGDFQPAYDRGRGIFILMGIIGIAMTMAGLWQLQHATNIATNLDLAKGPGLAFMGVLLVVVSAYYLLRRLNR